MLTPFRGYISKTAWAKAQWRVMRRLPYQAWLVVRRSWWIAIGERQRVTEERDRYKAWGEQQFARARAADHAVYILKVEHRGASVDVLRAVADRIDCEPGCEHVSPMDWSTGQSECHLSDRGECPFDDACALRELADALQTHAAYAQGMSAGTAETQSGSGLQPASPLGLPMRPNPSAQEPPPC